jgi:predicted extracellular nuclease
VQAGAPADYARLNLDTVWSTPTDLYGFGGRGFSIFRQNADGSITKVEETGGDIEQIIAGLPNAGTVFNGENGAGFDTRSDNKGAEPEGVAVGVVDGVPYAFVTLERIGGLMVWDLSNPEDARYVRYLPPTSQDYGPEVVTFISAADSPNGRALVLSANEVSGSVTVYEVSSLTPISAIQGSGTASPLVGQTVTVEAIVVGDFQNNDADQTRNLGGFWLQEEAFDSDGNPLTSEGIFVAQNALPADVQLGDRVRVTGTVAEVFNNTEINATAITVVQAGAVADVNTLAVAVDLPAAGVQGSNGNYRADLERYEGMLVKFPETLTVTEQFNLDQFGEIVVTEGPRPASFTETNAPSVAGFDAHLRDIAARSVVFDDGRGTSNPPLADTVVDGAYTTANAPRMGDTVSGLTGVLDFDFNEFRVRSIENGPGVNDFTSANPRPAAPADVGGTLKVASFNVLNYFTTLDDGGRTDNGFEPRGAETPAEFARQTEKLVNVLLALTPT